MATNYKPIATNRRANFDYDIQQTFLAGIVLHGHEVKSVRAGHVSLKGTFAKLQHDELWVLNMHITKYANADVHDYDPVRSRKLLLNRKELHEIDKLNKSGWYIVILSIGLSGRYIKTMVGLGPSKKRHDKRQSIKQREDSIRQARAMKHQ